MQLYHDKCGSEVYVELSPFLEQRGIISITGSGIIVNTINIIPTKTRKKKSLSFLCGNCGSVELENTYGFCDRCGNRIPFSSLGCPERSDGVYCPSCITRFEEKIITMEEIVSKGVFTLC